MLPHLNDIASTRCYYPRPSTLDLVTTPTRASECANEHFVHLNGAPGTRRCYSHLPILNRGMLPTRASIFTRGFSLYHRDTLSTLCSHHQHPTLDSAMVPESLSFPASLRRSQHQTLVSRMIDIEDRGVTNESLNCYQ
jgi:hypothetical protein